MKYRHIKTGAVIDINCELRDKEWEAVEVPAPAAPAPVQEAPAPKKTARKKKE